MDLNAAPVRTVAFTALIAIIVNVLAGHPDVPRAPQLRSLPHRQLVEPPEIMLYDPDGCTPAGIKWSAGDCGLVERYLQAGHVALYKRNMLAMGSKTDADGHSCAAAFWEPGPAGSCCNYSPRVVESDSPSPEIRIDCTATGRVSGISWGLNGGTLADQDWLYLPSLEYLRIFGTGTSSLTLDGPFPKWIHHHSNLKYLFVENTELTGEIEDLSDLYQLETLHINKNLFTGPIPILPASLTALSLVNNRFSGEIMTELFPGGLQYCALSNNTFCYVGDTLLCGPRDEMEIETNMPYGVQSCADREAGVGADVPVALPTSSAAPKPAAGTKSPASKASKPTTSAAAKATTTATGTPIALQPDTVKATTTTTSSAAAGVVAWSLAAGLVTLLAWGAFVL